LLNSSDSRIPVERTGQVCKVIIAVVRTAFCLLGLAACSRQGAIERWELPIERVRVRPSDCSFLVSVAGKTSPKEFYIEHRKMDGYQPGVLLDETDVPWTTGQIEYINRTHDVGRSNEGTSEEYTITIHRNVPPGTDLWRTPASVQLSCITLPDGAGRFIDAESLSDLNEFVDVKVAHWTTLKYLRSREGHDYWH
jgi:hypothetical protein